MKNFLWARALSIAKKEVRHVWRDPFTLAMAVGVPLFLVVFFGYILNFDVRDIRLTVEDRDRTADSRTLTRAFTASGYFLPDPDDGTPPLAHLEEGRSRAALFIAPGFSRDLARGRTARAQIVIDGADNQSAEVIAGYLDGVRGKAVESLTDVRAPAGLRTRFLFNNELNTQWFVVPGLFVVVMGVLSILLTALTVAREWETGSMELLLATPVRPLEIIVGKLAPYLALCLGGVGLIFLAARTLFHVPFRGNPLVFAAACALFLICTLSQGLLISVATRQQQLAMQLSNISGLLPATLLSGFIFPIESMPPFFQTLTLLLPPRHFMTLCRGIFLKGAGPGELAGPFIALTLLGAGLILLALRKFKKDLEP